MASDDPSSTIIELHRSSEQYRDAVQRLQRGGGGGTSGGVTDDWKASVDRQLGQLHGDVRALLRVGTGAAVGLAALVGGLYLRTDAKFLALLYFAYPNARGGAKC